VNDMKIKERLRSRTEQARERAEQTRERVQSAANAKSEGLREGVEGFVHETKERRSELPRKNPIVLGLFGFAIGVALGSRLPMSQRESELMEQARDLLRERAEPAIEQAKTAIGQIRWLAGS
jgi:hypothetical protein